MPEMHSTAKVLLTSGPYQFFARRIVLPWALQGGRPAGEGLEIGAGGGAMTAQLLSVFPTLRMVTTDDDPDMVDKAQRSLASFGDRAAVERADAADLPFQDNRFDLVLSAAMLHHVVAWESAVAEAVRVLRPGGRLVGYDLLDAAPIRFIHHGQAEDTRMVRAGQLETEFDRLSVTGVRVRRALRGLIVKFGATKAT